MNANELLDNNGKQRQNPKLSGPEKAFLASIIFGFVAGLVISSALYRTGKLPTQEPVEQACICLAIIIGCFALPFACAGIGKAATYLCRAQEKSLNATENRNTS